MYGRIDYDALDRYITGNYGEDQYADDIYPDEGIDLSDAEEYLDDDYEDDGSDIDIDEELARQW